MRGQLGADQWRALQLAPFLVLSGLAGRYRDFAVEESAVFEWWLSEAARAPGVLTQEVLSSVAADLAAVTTDYEDYSGTIASGLTAVHRILAAQPQQEADAFREALIHVLGAGLARARGPYGRELTPQAVQMLATLEELLRPELVFSS